ncbi:MAG TPA: type II secretion system protein [bacterium]|nr:type II secretion system protein [bacterium]
MSCPLAGRTALRARRRGYTLIELLTVASIIGILATMAIASVARARTGTREKAAIATLTLLANGYTNYYARNGSFPHWGPGLKNTTPQALWSELTTGGYFPTKWNYYRPDPVTGLVLGPIQGYALEIPPFEADAAGVRGTDNYFAVILHPRGFQEGYLAVIVDPLTDRSTPVPLSSDSPEISTFSLYKPRN